MVAPSGVRGIAFFAKGGTLVGGKPALEHLAAVAEGGFAGVDIADGVSVLGVEAMVGGGESPAAAGDSADAAPGATRDLEDLGDQLLGAVLPVSLTTGS